MHICIWCWDPLGKVLQYSSFSYSCVVTRLWSQFLLSILFTQHLYCTDCTFRENIPFFTACFQGVRIGHFRKSLSRALGTKVEISTTPCQQGFGLWFQVIPIFIILYLCSIRKLQIKTSWINLNYRKKVKGLHTSQW